MVLRGTGNNAYAKFWRDKQRVFLILAKYHDLNLVKWPISHNYLWLRTSNSEDRRFDS